MCRKGSGQEQQNRYRQSGDRDVILWIRLGQDQEDELNAESDKEKGGETDRAYKDLMMQVVSFDGKIGAQIC